MASDRSLRKTCATLLSALCVLGMLAERPALAEPSAADKETARNLMKEGDDKFAAHDYPGAMKAYQAAHAIMQVPTTGLPLARAQIERGLLVEARDTLLQVMRMPREPNEPGAYGKAREEAGPLAMKLADRIPSVTITVEAPSGTQADVNIDGVAVPPAGLGTPRKVNPGAHTVVASASGFKTAKKNVVLKETENQTVALKLVAGVDAPDSTPAANDVKGGGKIHVQSVKEPGNVIIDGKAVGATPLDVPVSKGPHKVEVEYPGGSRDVRKVDVAAGATVNVDASPSPMDAIASHRKGAHLGFSAAALETLFLGGGGPTYGAAGSFIINVGITPTFDFRTGATGVFAYRARGPAIFQVNALIPALLKVNYTPWFSFSAGLTLGFEGLFFTNTNVGNQYGFVAGPEWSPFTISAGDKRQFELGFTQGMRFGTVDPGAWEYHQAVTFTYLSLD